MGARQRVTHTIAPVYDDRSRVLVLGSIPSPKSREVGFYYGNPQNRFWRVMAALWGEPVSQDTQARREFCLRHRLALWDVVASCVIEGAADSSICDVVPNDVNRILAAADVRQVFCTGQTAGRLYRRMLEPVVGMPCTVLPSTSPANARWSLDALVEAYAPVRLVAEGLDVESL